LNDKHAQRAPCPQDRHAEKRVERLFSGFREIGKARVSAGIRQVQRPGLGSDQANKALADTQRGIVDRLPVQAFGRIELKNAVSAQDINRTHFGDDIRGDQHNDLVESLLRRDRLRHDFAEPAEQKARSG